MGSLCELTSKSFISHNGRSAYTAAKRLPRTYESRSKVEKEENNKKHLSCVGDSLYAMIIVDEKEIDDGKPTLLLQRAHI